MASWDDEDFDPDAVNDNVPNNWGGEDEDDNDLKDNWDDAEEEKKVLVPKSEPKKKKTITEKIKEKEEKRRQEFLAKQEEMRNMQDENGNLSPEEEIEEKLRRQRLQEESDLELAKETFGVTTDLPEVKTIDNFIPVSKDEFKELAAMIVQKFSNFEARAEYPIFLETLIRDCCAGAVESEDIKKISNTLNLLYQEKQKLSNAAKGKKKTAAASKKTLSTGKGTKKGDMDYDNSYYDEYEDFM